MRGVAEDAIERGVKLLGLVEFEKVAVAGVDDKVACAGGGAGEDGALGSPGFEDDEPEGFGEGRDDDGGSALEEADETLIAGREGAGEGDAIFDSGAAGVFLQGLAVSFICAGAGEDDVQFVVATNDGGKLFEDPALVFDGIDSTQDEEVRLAAKFWKSAAGGFAMVVAIVCESHSVRVDDDSFGGIFFLKQSGFAFVAGDDGIGVGKDSARTERGAQNFSPFEPAFERLGELVADLLREVEGAAMNRDDEGKFAEAGGGQADAADAIESVGMDDVGGFAEKAPD